MEITPFNLSLPAETIDELLLWLDDKQDVIIKQADLLSGTGQSTTATMTQKAITDAINAGYLYKGIATPATNPGTPDANVFYLASGAGTYTNFGGIVINEGEVCALVWNGTWAKQVTGIATTDQLNQLGQDILINRFVGDGSSYVSTRLNLIRGQKYRIVLDNPNYERDNTGTEPTNFIFVIVSYVGSTMTRLVEVTRSEGTINKSYDFIVPNDSDYVAIGGRANSGVSVRFGLFVLDVEVREEMRGLLMPIVRKNSYVNSSHEYTDNDDWYVGSLVPISNGDSILYNCPISVNDNSPQKVGFYDENGELYQYNAMYNNRNFTSNLSGYIAMSTRKSDADLFKITVNNVLKYQGSKLADNSIKAINDEISAINDEISAINDEISAINDEISSQQENILINSFVGNGSNYVSTRLNLVKGLKYRVVLDNPSYARDNTGTDATQFLFSVESYNGSSLIALIKVTRSEGTINKTYEFTVPNDSKYVTIGGRANSGVEVKFEVYAIEVNEGIITRNQDKIDLLRAASNNGRRLQLLIATDSHQDWNALQNAISFANACEYIDGILLPGDNCGQAISSLADFQRYYQIVGGSAKPVFSIPGNHDAGYDKRLRYTISQDVVNQYITAPTLSFLESEENPSGKNYYFHDFTSKKIRLICLDEYDEQIQLEPNSYWEQITYNPTLGSYEIGVSYGVGDERNFGLYTANSFRCIQAHTSSTDNEIRITEYRGFRFIGATQMAWLVSTMLSTPAGYGLVISTHIPASNGFNTPFRENKFSSKYLSESSSFNAMSPDILGILANAFNNGASGTITVKAVGDFSYLNIEGSGDNAYAYELSYDFSGKNTGAKFLVFLCGHTHFDIIFKNSFDIYSISPTFTTAITRQYDTNDCPRSGDDNNIARDALTVVAFEPLNDSVILTRVGTTSTTDGYKRDVDRLSINQ